MDAKRGSGGGGGGGGKLGSTSGVFIPVYLNILSILMFLRFGLILGQIGFVGILGQCEFEMTYHYLYFLSR